jgi:hypothetical protein
LHPGSQQLSRAARAGCHFHTSFADGDAAAALVYIDREDGTAHRCSQVSGPHAEMRRRLTLDPVERATGILDHLDDAARHFRAIRNPQLAAGRHDHELSVAHEHCASIGTGLHRVAGRQRCAPPQRLRRPRPVKHDLSACLADRPGRDLRQGRRAPEQEQCEQQPAQISSFAAVYEHFRSGVTNRERLWPDESSWETNL